MLRRDNVYRPCLPEQLCISTAYALPARLRVAPPADNYSAPYLNQWQRRAFSHLTGRILQTRCAVSLVLDTGAVHRFVTPACLRCRAATFFGAKRKLPACGDLNYASWPLTSTYTMNTHRADSNATARGTRTCADTGAPRIAERGSAVYAFRTPCCNRRVSLLAC